LTILVDNVHNKSICVPSKLSSTVLNSRSFHQTVPRYNETITVLPPSFPDSVSEGDIQWEKAVGDEVAEDDVIGQIETEKVSLAVTAPAAGVILELLIEDGSRVEAKTPLVTIQIGGASAVKATPAPDVVAPPAAPTPAVTPPTPSKQAGPIPTSPPPVPPLPTAPISTKPTSAVTPVKAAPITASMSDAKPKGDRSESRVKVSRMRKRIAQRLKDAQNTCAMLTTFNEIDMTNIMDIRNRHKDAFLKKHGVKFGFMSAFLKASAYALEMAPEVNAVIDDNEIIYRDYIDISVAVATPKGLVVPVLRNVESMSYAMIEKALGEMGQKAKTNALAIEDMDGGTFTISNGGVFGSLMGTPIINPPQSAILGMHGIFERPVAIKGKVEVRPMMYVALTYDHRLIDGREGVMFLRAIKTAVEEPVTMLLEL